MPLALTCLLFLATPSFPGKNLTKNLNLHEYDLIQLSIKAGGSQDPKTGSIKIYCLI